MLLMVAIAVAVSLHSRDDLLQLSDSLIVFVVVVIVYLLFVLEMVKLESRSYLMQ